MPIETIDESSAKSQNISLRDYLESRLDAMEKSRQQSDKALEKRLDALNEIREALRDRDATFITKVEFRAVMLKIEETVNRMEVDVRDLRESRATLAGKADQSALTSVSIIAISGLIISLISLALRIVLGS